MKKFMHFLTYNNTVPLVFGVLFLGAGATFAAAPAAREAVLDSEVVVTEVDNSYLLETTINDSTVTITIGSVTENDEEYYIEYQLGTMEARDGVWQPVTRTKTLIVNKESVVGRDLGLYAEEEIAEVHAAEIRLLKETQASERRAGLTPKVVTTQYSGLVGQFFDPSQEVFPQYDPLIAPDVGIPLNREQEKAHEVVRRLIEEAKEQEQQQQEEFEEDTPAPDADEGPVGEGDGGSAGAPLTEESPVEAPSSEPLPPSEPESETTSPPTLESIGL